jgi:tetratricopeptide (TPR) repeat protein
MRVVSGVAVMMLAVSAGAYAAPYCGSLKTGFGPFDYSQASTADLELVEAYHFTEDVEKLISGATGPLGGDLDYTLRVFPNHRRALAALARLGLRDKTVRPSGTKWSVECYFERAMRFKPRDAGVRTIYGGYLFKLGRTDDALTQLTEAVQLEPDNGTANYNLGLIHFQKKNYEMAAVFAKKADSIGFPLPGLKSKLVEMGKWDSASEK